MKQYIEKDRILAEIKKKKIPFKKDIDDGVYPTYLCALMDFEDFINTLEVKEVNLDEEITIAMPHRYSWSGDGTTMLYTEEQMKDFAKYFFELGIKVTQKGEEV